MELLRELRECDVSRDRRTGFEPVLLGPRPSVLPLDDWRSLEAYGNY